MSNPRSNLPKGTPELISDPALDMALEMLLDGPNKVAGLSKLYADTHYEIYIAFCSHIRTAADGNKKIINKDALNLFVETKNICLRQIKAELSQMVIITNLFAELITEIFGKDKANKPLSQEDRNLVQELLYGGAKNNKNNTLTHKHLKIVL